MNENEPLDEVSNICLFSAQNRGDDKLTRMSKVGDLLSGCAVLGIKVA